MAHDAIEDIAGSDLLKALPRKRMGAGLVIVDDQMRVLLVEPTYKSNWEVPGGMVEVGESPRDAASREVLEELGLVVAVGRLLVIDWIPPRSPTDDGLVLLYAAGPIDTSQIKLPLDELRSWEWCDRETCIARLPDFMFRRIEVAVEALASGSTLELQNGYLVDSR